MAFFAPKNIEDLNKLKKLINQKNDIKKQRLNKKIQNTTLNYDLAEQYAPILNLQEKQIKGQEDNTRAIETQTKMLEEDTTPSIKSPILEAIEASDEEQTGTAKPIDGDISDMISSLLIQTNTHPQMKFSKKDFNNYEINKKPFKLYDSKIKFNEIEFKISPDFLNLFLKANNIDYSKFTLEESDALVKFINYAGGLRDTRSNLNQAFKFFKQKNKQETKGDGISFIFLSSDPNTLVERFEVLVGESLAGNTNAFREASAILHELLRMKEITETEYENAMKIFID